MKDLYGRLPCEIWDLIGKFLLVEVVQSQESIELILKVTRWTIVFEGKESYILDGWVDALAI